MENQKQVMRNPIVEYFANEKIEECETLLKLLEQMINMRKEYFKKHNKEYVSEIIYKPSKNDKIQDLTPKTLNLTPENYVYVPKIKNTDKYIYIINYNELYKIGISFDVYKRVSNIERTSGQHITIIYSKKLKNAQTIEKSLHNYFQNKRTIGEWFVLDNKDIKQAISLIEQASL